MLRSFVDPFVIGRPVVQLAKFMREQCEHRGVRLNVVCVWIGGSGLRFTDGCRGMGIYCGWFGVVVHGISVIFVRPHEEVFRRVFVHPREEVFRELELFTVVGKRLGILCLRRGWWHVEGVVRSEPS